MKKRKPYTWLRWIARITGTLMVLFFLVWMGGEILEGKGRPHTSFDFKAWTFFGIWSIATAGLVLALWKEGLGGIISLISYFLVFHLSSYDPVYGNYLITSRIVIAGLLVFPVGLILAIWYENLGAIVSLVGYILAFFPALIIRTGNAVENLHILFLVSSLPAVLYLVYWKLNRDKRRKADVIKPEEST